MEDYFIYKSQSPEFMMLGKYWVDWLTIKLLNQAYAECCSQDY